MGREIRAAIDGTVDQPSDRFQIIGGSSTVFEGELFHQGKKVTTKLLSHALERVELIFDFSSPEGNELLLDTVRTHDIQNRAMLIGTTGVPEDQLLRWKSTAEANGLRVLVAPNTSLGILAMTQTALILSRLLSNKDFDIEILETHHRLKKDAPSGTANFLANALVDQDPTLRIKRDRHGLRQAGEVGVVSQRGGGVFGEHEMRFLGVSEEVTLSHRAFDRSLFAKGALTLGQWVTAQKPGCYSLMDVDLSGV